jgi:two-component system nitrogen regulation response regulator NtrX
MVERLMLLATGPEIDASTVDLALPRGPDGSSAPASSPAGALSERVDDFERRTILSELRRHRHHITNTARALGLERSHLYKKCQQLGIDLHAERNS